jgi:hypothetical protein
VQHATPVSAEIELGDGQVAVSWQRRRHVRAGDDAIEAMEPSRLEECVRFTVYVVSCQVDQSTHDDIGNNAAGARPQAR